MKFLRFVLCVLSIFSFVGIASAKPAGNFVEGELLVKFKNNSNSNVQSSLNRQIGADSIKDFPDLQWQLIKLPANLSVQDAVATYQSFAEVEIAQPNFIYHIDATPNDTRYSELYGMTKIGATTAWDSTKGNSKVVIAVIDTGVNYLHEDLAANIWQNSAEIAGNGVDDDANGYIDDVNGYDFANGDANPDDDQGHGTHLAGTIGAVGNNAKGVTGVNWNVRLMVLKTHDTTGNSTSAKLVEAFNYARMMKSRGVNVKATNNSYGGCNEACGFDQATKDAIDAAGKSEILNVFAAGNNNRNIDTTPFYPASYDSPSIISVAASDANDNKASFSNTGTVGVDLAAPGVNILSTIRSGGYGFNSGTSMAAPHVAGAVALIASAYPNSSAQAIKARLLNSVDKLPQWNNLVKTGGRLNVARAIKARPVLDFDGDGRTDYSVIQNSNNAIIWHNFNLADGYSLTSFGLFSRDVAVPADYDGDGKTDIAVWRGDSQATFYFLNSGDNTFQAFNWGITGDVPNITQDFDGDGKADFAVTRKTDGKLIWYIFNSLSGFQAFQYGIADDKPLRGDFDGDGKADAAVYRTTNASPANTFIIEKSVDKKLLSINFGDSTTDKIIPADFDGDGKTDVAVWRRTDNVWYWLESSSGTFRAINFGIANQDSPASGDYDGDGKTDIAVWRTSSTPNGQAQFYINGSLNGFTVFDWGQNGMRVNATTLQTDY
ncbi:MAG: S8 family serine peptidase [Pyrinomonadaceae bacterium]|nr:S8 family serine peptidase [Pyrinomonadaceae bacterium]